MAFNFRNLLGSAVNAIASNAIPFVGNYIGGALENVIDGKGRPKSSPGFGQSLAQAFTGDVNSQGKPTGSGSAASDLFGKVAAPLAQRAFQSFQTPAPSYSSALSPQVQGLYSQLAAKAAQRLNDIGPQVQGAVQQAYDVAKNNLLQSSDEAQKALEARLNQQGILDSGVTLDENAKLQAANRNSLAQLAAQAAQAQLGMNRQAYADVLDSLPQLQQPGTLAYLDATRRAQEQNQRVNQFAPLANDLLSRFGTAIDTYFQPQATAYNPGANTVPPYRRQGGYTPRFGTLLGRY